jgi:hypothetical protein
MSKLPDDVRAVVREGAPRAFAELDRQIEPERDGR